MLRAAIVLALVSSVGCTKMPAKPSADELLPLTADERERWEKIRTAHASASKDDNAGRDFQVLAFVVDQKAWRFLYPKPADAPPSWTAERFASAMAPKACFLDSSKECAASNAAREGVMRCVVVDFFSDPDPKPVRWYYTKDAKPQDSAEPPSAEAAANLKGFLIEFQRNPQ